LTDFTLSVTDERGLFDVFPRECGYSPVALGRLGGLASTKATPQKYVAHPFRLGKVKAF
jgi:hypothetical protein